MLSRARARALIPLGNLARQLDAYNRERAPRRTKETFSRFNLSNYAIIRAARDAFGDKLNLI